MLSSQLEMPASKRRLLFHSEGRCGEGGPPHRDGRRRTEGPETGRKLRRYGSKLLITPSGKNMHAFLEKVRSVIRSNSATKQEHLIRLLTRSSVAGHTITVISKRIRRIGKWDGPLKLALSMGEASSSE